MGLAQPTSRRPTDASDKRRRSSVVIRQFLRKDPVAWKIRVNFEAQQFSKTCSSLAATAARRSTVNGSLLLFSNSEKNGRPKDAAIVTTQPLQLRPKLNIPEMPPTSRVQYIFGPVTENAHNHLAVKSGMDALPGRRRRSSAVAMPTQRSRKRFTLPIAIQGPSGTSKILSVADTGSDHNIISLELVEELGLQTEKLDEPTLRFVLPNGRFIEACGQVRPKFGFAGTFAAGGITMTGLFYVFKKLVVSVIIGRALLEETKTFTDHRHRLIEEIVPSLQVLKLGSNTPQTSRDILCRLNGHTGYAIADTGSDLDLVAPDFAKAKGFNINPSFERVQFADGSYGVTCGVVKSTFAIGSKNEEQGFVQKGAMIERDFYVLDGLTAEILVGLDTLEKLNVYDRYSDSLVQRVGTLSLSDANIIRYVGSAEHLTREAWKKIKSLGSKEEKNTTTGKTEHDIKREMIFTDQRENARREAARLLIASLKEEDKITAQEEEDLRIRTFEEERDRSIETLEQITDKSASQSESDSTSATKPESTCGHSSCGRGNCSKRTLLKSFAKVPKNGFKVVCDVKGCPRTSAMKGFSTKEQLDQHKAIHRGSDYICPFCPGDDRSYSGPRLLSRHVIENHADMDRNEPIMQELFNADLISSS